MSNQYVVELIYGQHGLPFVSALTGARLTAEVHEDTITIRGNSAGLLFLAHNLIALAKAAEERLPQGYHIHIDDLYEINEEGIEFILRRDDAPR